MESWTESNRMKFLLCSAFHPTFRPIMLDENFDSVNWALPIFCSPSKYLHEYTIQTLGPFLPDSITHGLSI